MVRDLLAAYRQGAFPMASSRGAKGVEFYTADPRAIVPLSPPPCPGRTLRAQMRRSPMRLASDTAFEQVVRACADVPRPGGSGGTWINDWIIRAYTLLHRSGHAHSVEAWLDEPAGPRLVGGLYGVRIGGALFGESMFTAGRPGPHAPEAGASKACFFALVHHLRARGVTLLDTQFANPHTTALGAVEVPLADYLARLGAAVDAPVTWGEWTLGTGADVLRACA